jgi:hypothetical protein
MKLKSPTSALVPLHAYLSTYEIKNIIPATGQNILESPY